MWEKNTKKKRKRNPNVVRRALLIGCNYPRTKAQLNGCINDVNAMNKYLIQRGGFLKKEITQLTDHLGALPHQQPTRENILSNIQSLVNNIPKNKKVILFFHFSGHGSYTYERGPDKDEEDGRDETICPTDFSKSGMIKDDDLKVHLIDALPANVKLYCVMDCCHSGTGMDLRYECRTYNEDGVNEYKLHQNKMVTKSKAEVVLFSGCKDNQYSADAYIWGKYQGAMTWGFLQVLNKHNYEPISYKRLLREVQELLRRKKYEQIPQLSTGKYVDLKEKFTLL